MTVRQISVFIENKYGKLSEILALLGNEDIRIVGATVADTSEYGILRLIVTEPDKANKILKNNNINVNMTDVFALVAEPLASSFAQILNYFSQAGISIEYMYSFSIKDKSVLIIRSHNCESARDVIRRHSLDFINENDLIFL